MRKTFIKPNWTKSNLNISATLAEFLGAPNSNHTLPLLKTELEKQYKNVVFICFDGLGIHPIKANLAKNSFLRKNIKQVLTSTFPSTTTNATTSLACNKQPLEHGWFGWTLHFAEINRNIDIYLHSDAQTKEKVEYKYPIIDNTDYYFYHANSSYQVNTIFPSFIKTNPNYQNTIIENELDMCNAIKDICSKNENQFVYAYLPDPDETMHRFGVSSPQAKAKIESINNQVQKLFDSLENTLIIITADHGQVDTEGYIEFYDDKEINSLLECVPFLDSKSPAFIVKKGKKKQFEKLFKERYGKDFKLYKSSDLINKNYFGTRGNFGYLLGDYIAVGTFTHKTFLAHKNMPKFVGNHTSLTEEMEVPLILLCKK